MSLSFEHFLIQLTVHPTLIVVSGLIFAVLLVNGWTDAPNAITCAVVTNALTFPKAVLLAAVCNFLGVVCVTALSPAVAETLYSMAHFSGDPERTLCALCAGLVSVVVFAVAAWRFGIPTSESHALIAGISGAAVALEGNLSCINRDSWQKILWGLVLSLVLGLLLGRLSARLLHPLPLSPRRCRTMQIPGAAVSAFLHGAQDGQKFLGIFLLACALSQGHIHRHTFLAPAWLMTGCALIMALGTACGGRRIIDTIGREMVHLTPKEGVACELAGSMCLTLATLLGLPVSTTHTKTAALLGVGLEGGGGYNRGAVRSILTAWLLTFPCCFALGLLFARFFLAVL